MQYAKGHKKYLQTPRTLLRRDTIGDSEKHLSLRSFSWIGQYFINCIYSYFSVIQSPVSVMSNKSILYNFIYFKITV